MHPVFVGADQDHVGVRRDLRGRSGEYELLIEVVRILHLADDRRLLTLEFDGVTDRNAEQLCRPIGQGNLVSVHRIPPVADREHGSAEASGRILAPDLQAFRCSWYLQPSRGDDVDPAEPRVGIGDELIELIRVVTADFEPMAGQSEPAVMGRRNSVGGRRPEQRRGHGDAQQGDHEDVLSPLPPQHPRRPADDRAARRTPRPSPAHRAATNDSSPGGGIV